MAAISRTRSGVRRVIPRVDVDRQARPDEDEPARGDDGQHLTFVTDREEGIARNPCGSRRPAADLGL